MSSPHCLALTMIAVSTRESTGPGTQNTPCFLMGCSKYISNNLNLTYITVRALFKIIIFSKPIGNSSITPPQTPRAASPVWGEGRPRWPGRGQPPRVPAGSPGRAVPAVTPHVAVLLPQGCCGCRAAAGRERRGGGKPTPKAWKLRIQGKTSPPSSAGVEQGCPPRPVPLIHQSRGMERCLREGPSEGTLPASSELDPPSSTAAPEPSPPLFLGG